MVCEFLFGLEGVGVGDVVDELVEVVVEIIVEYVGEVVGEGVFLFWFEAV